MLKKDSPGCGLERVKVYDRHGSPVRGGRGLYAAALVEAYPYLPVEEEGRLADTAAGKVLAGPLATPTFDVCPADLLR